MDDDDIYDEFEERAFHRAKRNMKGKFIPKKSSQQPKQPKPEPYRPPPPPENPRMKYLRVLGLTSRDDIPVRIRSTYRRLALRYHPDKNSDPRAVETFKYITAAYEALT